MKIYINAQKLLKSVFKKNIKKWNFVFNFFSEEIPKATVTFDIYSIA